jgi:hypothetical protein
MMKAKSFFLPFMLFVFVFAMQSCKKDEVIDPTVPNGDFTSAKSGSFVDENGAGSAGTAQLGTDEDGTQFLMLSSNFATNFATGTVVVYLSTSATYTANPGAGNPDLRLIGYVTEGGQQYFRLDPAADAKFTHVLLYCASAGVQFGNAALN